MINTKLIYKIIGSLLLIEATMMCYCLAVALYYKENDVMAFGISILLLIASAIVLKYIGHNAENSMSRRDAYLLVTLTWIIFSLFGALPFYISGNVPNFTDAYFETMSGFTTTGASVIDDVEALPHALLFSYGFNHIVYM